MEQFVNELIRDIYPNMQYELALASLIVIALIIVVSIVSLFISICLAIAYIKYNHRDNSIGKTGEEIARKILDENGLGHIRVKATGSLLFGNSYSHYFKKVRLRRRTYKKKSLSSMVMATQKSALAILDKEGDPDMRRRIRLVPLITFGPFAFIPIVAVGVLLDYFIFSGSGMSVVICIAIGFLFYLYSFILSLKVLKTEKKAQARALQIMEIEHIANDAERKSARKLFKLYNIEYVNDMILSMLELIYYILRIVSMFQGGSSSVSSKD